MPVKLLVSFLAKRYISIDLGITFLIINASRNKMGTFLFENIFLINILFEVIVQSCCQLYRCRIFKVCLFSETNTIYSVPTLRNTIIFCIQNLIVDLVSTIVLKGFLYYLPCTPFVMTQHSFNILKYKDLWLAFDDKPRKLSEKSSTRIFKSAMLSSKRERLTWRSTYKHIYLSLI